MPADRHLRRSGNDYAQAFASLLPTGLAWPRERGSLLMKVVRGLAQIWGRVDASAADLLERESDPRQTVALLPEWERAWGLPEECLAEPQTVNDRQIALVNKMTRMGGQSRAFFIGLAASIGYTITITEYAPFMVGVSRVGDTRTFENPTYRWQIGHSTMRFYWTINVSNARLSWFRCGSGQCGVDPHLRIGLFTDLECLLGKLKPAHTNIVFNYSGLALGGSMAGTP